MAGTDSQSDDNEAINLDDLEITHFRLATKSNVLEVQNLLAVLTSALPPTATLAQALAFCVICKQAVSGQRVSASELRRLAEEDMRGVDILGPSVARTVRALAATGLVKITASEDDRRSKELSLTREGFQVLDKAMDMLS